VIVRAGCSLAAARDFFEGDEAVCRSIAGADFFEMPIGGRERVAPRGHQLPGSKPFLTASSAMDRPASA
jgi:hypothetical protein